MPEKQRVEIPPFEIVEKERERLLSRKRNIRGLLSGIGVLMVIAAISVIVATKIVAVLQVSGSSMEPTLKANEIVLFRKTDKIESQDIIAFYYQNKILIKRVIGLPGDSVDIKEDGMIIVNGQELEESYIMEPAIGECNIEFPYQVQEGEYFVLGDNRSVSKDSRSSQIGCVDRERIIGKAQLIVWPFQSIESLQ